MPAAVPGSLMRGKKIRVRATIELGRGEWVHRSYRESPSSELTRSSPPGLSEGNTPASTQHPSPTTAGAQLSHALLSTI